MLLSAFAMGYGSEYCAGVVAERGRVHDASRARSRVDDYHSVDWDSRVFEGVGSASQHIPTYAMFGSKAAARWKGREPTACINPASRKSSRTERGCGRDKVVADNVLYFFIKNPDLKVISSGIVARQGCAVGARRAALGLQTATVDLADAHLRQRDPRQRSACPSRR